MQTDHPRHQQATDRVTSQDGFPFALLHARRLRPPIARAAPTRRAFISHEHSTSADGKFPCATSSSRAPPQPCAASRCKTPCHLRPGASRRSCQAQRAHIAAQSLPSRECRACEDVREACLPRQCRRNTCVGAAQRRCSASLCTRAAHGAACSRATRASVLCRATDGLVLLHHLLLLGAAAAAPLSPLLVRRVALASRVGLCRAAFCAVRAALFAWFLSKSSCWRHIYVGPGGLIGGPVLHPSS